MTLEVQRYTHVPLYVQAVPVTAENIEEVATWCGGTLQTDDEMKLYIKVATIRPLRDRQTMAYVGDYVLKTDVGHKIYTKKAFVRGFVLAPEKVVDDRPEVMKTQLHAPEAKSVTPVS